jgi:hypothetical protein
MNTDQPIFDYIPQELWQLITTFLDAKSKRVLRLANKEWFNFINYDNFTIFFARDDNLSSIIEHFSKKTNPISLSFKKSMLTVTAQQFISTISILKNLISIEYEGRFENEVVTETDWIKLTNLTGIQAWALFRWQPASANLLSRLVNVSKLAASVSATDLTRSLKSMTNLEILDIEHRGEFSIDPFTLLQHPSKLTELNIRVKSPMQLLSNSASVEKFQQFCNLKVLNYENFSKDSLYIYLDNLTSIESLYIYAKESQPIHSNTNLTSLRMYVEKFQLEHLNQISQLRKLRELDIQWPNNVTYRRLDVLTALTDLQKFVIYDPTAHNIRDKSEDRNILNWISTNLKSLNGNFEVRDLVRFEQLEELALSAVTDDLDYLKNLTKLTALRAYLAHNISTVNILTNLKTLYLPGAKIPKDYKQLNLEQLTNLEMLSIASLAPLPSMFNMLSRLTKLADLTLNIHLDDTNLEYTFDNLKLTAFTNYGINGGEKLIQCIAKITTLNNLTFQYWKSEETIVQFSALEKLTYLELRPASGIVFFGRHLSVLTNLQEIHGIEFEPHQIKELKNKMPYLIYCPMTARKSMRSVRKKLSLA